MGGREGDRGQRKADQASHAAILTIISIDTLVLCFAFAVLFVFLIELNTDALGVPLMGNDSPLYIHIHRDLQRVKVTNYHFISRKRSRIKSYTHYVLSLFGALLFTLQSFVQYVNQILGLNLGSL